LAAEGPGGNVKVARPEAPPVGRVVTFLLGLFAATVFLASATVHVLVFVPGIVLPMERLVWTHLAAMLAFFAVIAHAAVLRNRAVASGQTVPDATYWLEGRVPCAVWAIGLALFLYAIVNFVQFVATTEGQAGVKDGAYVMQRKAVVLRELTEAEYHVQRAFELRGMSGHWMIFAWVSTAYFLFVAPRAREELESAPVP
jgi:hypothetical protein